MDLRNAWSRVAVLGCATVLLTGCWRDRFVDPGPSELVLYVDGKGSNQVTIVGDDTVEVRVHRGGWFLTGSTWKWKGAPGFNVVPQGDARSALVSAKNPSSSVALYQNLIVTEHDPQGNQTLSDQINVAFKAK